MARSKKKRIKYLKSLDDVPEFTSVKDEAEFWDTHSVAEIWDQLNEVEFEVGDPLKSTAHEHRRKKEAFTIKLEPKLFQVIEKIARQKNISYQNLIKHWIEEGIQRESIVC